MSILPIVLPLFFAILTLLFWNHLQVQKALSLVGSLVLAGVSLFILARVLRDGIQVLQIGNWPAPFGISIVIDLFSAIMLAITGVLALATCLYSQAQINLPRARFGFYPLFFFLLVGVNGAFTTGDLFNLYVWFEVMLMSSFVLIALGGERAQVEGAVKYVILNLLSSVLFLSAIGLLYNLAGSLNLAELAQRLPGIQPYGQVTVVSVLFIIAFGIKSAIFPLFFWLPASYHTPPITITALFSGLLTKVGIYSLMRVFTLLFTQDAGFTHTILLVLACLTMVIGVFGAAAQTDFRRLLSFHIISQIGYLLLALGLFSPLALAAGIYFMLHVILAKTALFLVSGLVNQISGSYDLKQLGGLYARNPAISLMFLLPALSLAGLPPLSGFFAKLALIIAGFELRQYLVIGVGLFVSFFTLYSMTKVWNEAFWKENKTSTPAQARPPVVSAWMWAPTLGLVILSTAVGLLAEPIFRVCQSAAMTLMDTSAYVAAVLGSLP